MTTIDTIRERSGLPYVYPIPDFPDYYLATDEYGRNEVWSAHNGKYHRKSADLKFGYRHSYGLHRNGKRHAISLLRICCLVWHGKPKRGVFANCEDGFYDRLKPSTVKWRTRAYIQRLFCSRVDGDTIRTVKELYGQGASQREISRRLNVGRKVISDIVKGTREAA